MADSTFFDETIRNIGEIGYVVETRFPIAVANGLPGASLNEMLLFETGDTGYIFSLDEDNVQAGILGRSKIPVGTRVTRTNRKISYKFYKDSGATITDPLGEVILGESHSTEPDEELPLFVDIWPLISRRNVTKQLVTGITTIDFLLPIGRGQRELLVGDRKTGKRQVLLQTAKNAVQSGLKVIYTAVGQNHSDIHLVWKFFKDNNVANDVHVIATSPFDSPCMIYMTPFSGMAIAEYYATHGQDALLLIEDLTTHAQFYREFALVSGRMPGRESYPGDIFYTHAHLLERAGNYDLGGGKEVSITCLPMIHTPEGDISTYIATNSIGITDGHLFFDKERFLKGILPPIHTGLSVTRAGKQTLTQLLRDINRNITTFLSEYENTLAFSSFGSEISESVKDVITKGELITTFLRQSEPVGHSVPGDLLLLGMIWNGLYTENKEDTMNEVRHAVDKNINSMGQDMLQAIDAMKKFDELNTLIVKNKERVLEICERKT